MTQEQYDRMIERGQGKTTVIVDGRTMRFSQAWKKGDKIGDHVLTDSGCFFLSKNREHEVSMTREQAIKTIKFAN